MRDTLEEAVVLAVDPHAGTLTVLDKTGALIDGVIPVVPYAHPVENHGFKFHPDPGTHCMLHFSSDGTVYSLGCIMPPDSSNKRNFTPDGDSSTVEVRGRFGNAVSVESNGIARLISTAIAQVVAIPVLNLVRIVAERFDLQNALGELKLNLDKETLLEAILHTEDGKSTVGTLTVKAAQWLAKFLDKITITITSSYADVQLGNMYMKFDSTGLSVGKGTHPTIYINGDWEAVLSMLAKDISKVGTSTSKTVAANTSIALTDVQTLLKMLTAHKNLRSS